MKKIISAIALVCGCSLLSAQNTNAGSPETSVGITGTPLAVISQTTLLYGGIALVAALIVGFLIYRFFKNTADKKSDLIPVIKNIYPNPSRGPITIEIAGKASQLKVFAPDEELLGSFAVSGGDVRFDLTKAPRGNFIVRAYYGTTESNTARFELE